MMVETKRIRGRYKKEKEERKRKYTGVNKKERIDRDRQSKRTV
jgi:hypothetical protein